MAEVPEPTHAQATAAALETAALLETAAALEVAMKGPGVVWLGPVPGQAPPTGAPTTTGPVWHVWSDGAAYLLTGPGEQPLPGVLPGRCCQVTVRGSHGGRALSWTAHVDALDPDSAEWAEVASKLAAGRLNGGDPAAVLPTWPGRLRILCLRPTGELITAATGSSEASGAAPPMPTPASTAYRMPSDITRNAPWRRRRRRNRAQ